MIVQGMAHCVKAYNVTVHGGTHQANRCFNSGSTGQASQTPTQCAFWVRAVACPARYYRNTTPEKGKGLGIGGKSRTWTQNPFIFMPMPLLPLPACSPAHPNLV